MVTSEWYLLSKFDNVAIYSRFLSETAMHIISHLKYNLCATALYLAWEGIILKLGCYYAQF
jgi:hypothetical protein